MKVQVKLIQYDLSSREEKLIADGNAIKDRNTLKYKESQEDALHFVTFDEDSVILERKCEISSRTVLMRNGYGKAVVSSPYGDMEMETKTFLIEQNDDEWIVEYGIFSENNEIFRQRLVWKINYLS